MARDSYHTQCSSFLLQNFVESNLNILHDGEPALIILWKKSRIRHGECAPEAIELLFYLLFISVIPRNDCLYSYLAIECQKIPQLPLNSSFQYFLFISKGCLLPSVSTRSCCSLISTSFNLWWPDDRFLKFRCPVLSRWSTWSSKSILKPSTGSLLYFFLEELPHPCCTPVPLLFFQ